MSLLQKRRRSAVPPKTLVLTPASSLAIMGFCLWVVCWGLFPSKALAQFNGISGIYALNHMTFGVTSPLITTSPGSGYAVNDTITLDCPDTSTALTTKPTVTVTGIGAGGAITSSTLTSPGFATAIPTTGLAGGQNGICNFIQLSTSGSGTGATFTAPFAFNAASSYGFLTSLNLTQPITVSSSGPIGTLPALPILESISVSGTSNFVGAYPLNSIKLNDTSIKSGSYSNNIGFEVNYILNSGFADTANNGGRDAITAAMTVSATPGQACCAVGPGYSGFDAYGLGLAPSFGTGNGFSTAGGGIDAANFISELGPTATNWWSNQIVEFDTHNLAGSSVYANEGIEIVQLADDAVQGSEVDCGLCIANVAGAVGWKTALIFGDAAGVLPVGSTGTLIGCQGPHGNLTACGTAGIGIDWRNLIFSTYSLAVPGFNIGPTGVTTIQPPTTLPIASSSLVVESNDGTNGAQIAMQNNAPGTVNPSKFLRINSSGALQLLNNAYSIAIMSVTDSGILNALGFSASGASGVSCAAGSVSLTTLTITSGIVTHC